MFGYYDNHYKTEYKDDAAPARVVTSTELKKNFQVLDLTEVRQQQLSSRREEEKRIASGSLETQGSDIIIILLSGGRSCQKQHQHCHCPKNLIPHTKMVPSRKITNKLCATCRTLIASILVSKFSLLLLLRGSPLQN